MKLEKHSIELLAPDTCSAHRRREFERMVRVGFDGSDQSLSERIRRARCLAFAHTADGALVGIAGVKEPDEAHRVSVFRQTEADADPASYRLELGWVYVTPSHRRRGTGESLCRDLLARVAGPGVFATSRTDNAVMHGILLRLGFTPTGRPYRRPERDEELQLFLRAGSAGASDRAGAL